MTTVVLDASVIVKWDVPTARFDTLYHAVSLHHRGATYVTADDRYYRAARRIGAIARLRDLDLAAI